MMQHKCLYLGACVVSMSVGALAETKPPTASPDSMYHMSNMAVCDSIWSLLEWYEPRDIQIAPLLETGGSCIHHMRTRSIFPLDAVEKASVAMMHGYELMIEAILYETGNEIRTGYRFVGNPINTK